MIPQFFQIIVFTFVTYLFITWYAFNLKIKPLNAKSDPDKRPAVFLLSIVLAGVEIVLLRNPAMTWPIIATALVGLFAYWFMKPAIDQQIQREREQKEKENAEK